jgi:tetratricopeptide (TPR) repeat protein
VWAGRIIGRARRRGRPGGPQEPRQILGHSLRRARARPCRLLGLLLELQGRLPGDDIDAIADNPHLKSLWPLTAAMSAPPDTTLAGRPVASLTFALNYALAPADVRDVVAPRVQAPLGSPMDPFFRSVWGYHAVNLAVHIGAALLLFGVVRRTLLSAPLRARFGSGPTALAFAVSLLWLLHPLQTESVTYVVQRVESLMGLFYLSTLYGAIRALEAGPGTSRRLWTAASIAACVLGMGSKEAMVGAPIMVALSLPPRQGADVGPTAAAHMYLGSALCPQNKLEEGISHLEQALALNPRLSEAQGFLAEAYVSQGRYSKAAASFEQALAGLPDLPPLLHRAAWFYATTPDALVRNATKAVELAERAVQLTSGRNWMILDVLGVAYAEQGNFAEASAAVRRTLDIARSGGLGSRSCRPRGSRPPVTNPLAPNRSRQDDHTVLQAHRSSTRAGVVQARRAARRRLEEAEAEM